MLLKNKIFICFFFFQLIRTSCFAQQINFGGGYERNALIIKNNDDKSYQGFNSISFFTEYQNKILLTGLSLDFNILPVSINKKTQVGYSHTHGSSSGQYSDQYRYKTLKYDSKLPSFNFALYIGINLQPEKGVSFIPMLSFGFMQAIGEKVTKDSLIITDDDTYSNAPLGIYSHTITYTYGTSENTNLTINKSNLFLTPSIGLRINPVDKNFSIEVRTGINIFFRDIYFYSQNTQSGNRILNTNSVGFLKLSFIHHFSKKYDDAFYKMRSHSTK